MLEIAGREANGSCGCAPVGCGTVSGLVRRSTRGAGQRGPSRRDKSGVQFPAYAVAVAEERSARPSGVAPANCALGTLAY